MANQIKKAIKKTSTPKAKRVKLPKTPGTPKVPSEKGMRSAEVATTKLGQKWLLLFKKSSDLEPSNYSIVGSYEPKTALLHKTLGWGYVLSSRNDRLEVLFQDGIKYLISNYKRD